MTAEDDPVAAGAEAELRRLEQFEDKAWAHQALWSNAPPLVKVGAFVFFIVGMTAIGLTAREALGRDDAIGWFATAAMIAMALGFVFVVTKLERHYAPIKVDSLLPPKRILDKYEALYVVIVMPPVGLSIAAFLFAAGSAKSWHWFVGISLAFVTVAWLWGQLLKSLGVVDRLAPPEAKI